MAQLFAQNTQCSQLIYTGQLVYILGQSLCLAGLSLDLSFAAAAGHPFSAMFIVYLFDVCANGHHIGFIVIIIIGTGSANKSNATRSQDPEISPKICSTYFVSSISISYCYID